MTDHYMGANTPSHLQWMVGKTVEEIDAIKEEAKATGRTSQLAEVATEDGWKKRLKATND